MGAGYVLPFFYLAFSLFFGQKAGNNPGMPKGWNGPSLLPRRIKILPKPLL
jgi:hypothetical protein